MDSYGPISADLRRQAMNISELARGYWVPLRRGVHKVWGADECSFIMFKSGCKMTFDDRMYSTENAAQLDFRSFDGEEQKYGGDNDNSHVEMVDNGA